MGYKTHFQRDYQIGGGTNALIVAGCILAVIVALIIVAVYWCRGRNIDIMGLRAQRIFQDAKQIR